MGADLLALGLAEASDTRVVEVSRGAVARTGALLRDALFSDGRQALIVADERTWAAAGEAVQESLVAAGVGVAEPLVFPGRPVLYAELENSHIVRRRLRESGALAQPEALAAGDPDAYEGLVSGLILSGLPRATYYRSRYTVLDLARETGWFDELVDEVFAPGGLWT